VETTKPRESFERDGYFVARAIFGAGEISELREHYMRLRAQGPKPGDMGGDASRGAADPLNKFARMINMHEWDPTSLAWQQDPRLVGMVESLVGDQVLLCQTMIYFKPPGARGQALHQDNQYLRKYPIIAAWVALDDCDEENGQLVIFFGGFTIHGSHPNRTTDRFRRSLSIHYYAAHTQELPRDPKTMMSELAGGII
jgi:phytanoyl-CoA hydroxylase